jgi:hypothetical protein
MLRMEENRRKKEKRGNKSCGKAGFKIHGKHYEMS